MVHSIYLSRSSVGSIVLVGRIEFLNMSPWEVGGGGGGGGGSGPKGDAITPNGMLDASGDGNGKLVGVAGKL